MKSENKQNLFNILLLIVLGIIIFLPIFKEGYLIYVDNPVHLAETYSFLQTVKDHNWITGWSYDDFAGYPLNQYRYPAGTWITSLIHGIFGASVETSYKLTVLLAFVFPAIALYLLLSRRIGKLPALITGSILLFQQQFIVKASAGVYSILLASGFLILYIDLLDISLFSGKTSFKKSAILATLFSLTLFSHPYAALAGIIFSLIAFVIFAYGKGHTKENLIHLLAIPILSFLISSFYLLPLLQTGSWTDEFIEIKGVIDFLRTQAFVFFKAPESAFTILNVLIVSAGSLIGGILGILGISQFIKSKKDENKNLLLCTILFIFASILMTTGFWHRIPFLSHLPFAKGLIYSRFALFEVVGLLIFAGLFISKKIKNPNRTPFAVVAILIIASLFVMATVHRKNFETSSEPEVKQVEEMWSWISQNVKTDSRIAYETTAGNANNKLRETNILALSSHKTGLQSLGVWFGGSIFPIERQLLGEGNILGMPVENADDKKIAARMDIFDAKCIVSVEEKLRNVLINSSVLEHRKTIGFMDLFCLKTEPYLISFTDRAYYKMINFDDWELKVRINNQVEGNDALIKIQYHPYWSAYINDERIQINKNEYIMMSIDDLPKGEFVLEMRYNPINKTHIILSAMGIIAAVMLCWRREE